MHMHTLLAKLSEASKRKHLHAARAVCSSDLSALGGALCAVHAPGGVRCVLGSTRPTPYTTPGMCWASRYRRTSRKMEVPGSRPRMAWLGSA